VLLPTAIECLFKTLGSLHGNRVTHEQDFHVSRDSSGDGLPNSYEIYEALEVLSSFAFDVKKLPFYDLGILRNAMTNIQEFDDMGG
jgi:hypothetical protein